jgi:Tfp pilus assembly protein PilF
MSDATRTPTTHDARRQVEAAFDSGDLATAKALAAQLALRVHLGPWEHFALGRVALATGESVSAVKHLEVAHEQRPEEGAILTELAAAYAARRNWRAAADTVAKAIALRADIPAVHERHAIYLSNAGETDAAKAALERALALDPKSPSALTLMGEWLISAGDNESARAYFERAVAHLPGHPASVSNLALLEEKAGRRDAAMTLLSQVRGTSQEEAQARRRIGLLRLSQGDLVEGWPAYAARLKLKDYKSWQHLVKVPYWSGESLSDSHVLVWTDQGLGEQILTAGLIPELVALAHEVTLACDPRLVPLFARSFPGVRVMSLNDLKDDDAVRSDINIQATISELGQVLRPSADRFPAAAPYLVADGQRTEALRARVQDGESDRPLVGISWRSSNPLAGDAKSTSLADHWNGVLAVPGVRFVSLQYGDTEKDISASGANIVTLPDLDMTRDVDGFAALCAAMDLVVSTSNTSVHVAGALGKPVLAVLPQHYGRPWYWFSAGDTAPWYPDVTLFRSTGDWSEVLEQVAAKLALIPK